MGTPQSFDKQTDTGYLTEAKQRQLNKIDCIPSSSYYHRGLVNLRLKTSKGTTNVDVVRIKEYVDAHLHSIVNDDLNDPRAQRLHLLHRVASALQEAAEKPNKLKQYEGRLCLAERNVLLAQIGCLFLPYTFIGALQSPVAFIYDTAPALGKYILSQL